MEITQIYLVVVSTTCFLGYQRYVGKKVKDLPIINY